MPKKSQTARSPIALTTGLAMAAVLILIAVFAPIFLSGDANTLTAAVREAPGASHFLGTDQFGRDVFARTLVATRLTLILAVSATIMSVIIGVFIGGFIWLAPRKFRDLVLRIIDSSVAFPSLILALVIAAILGPGAFSAVIAIGVAGIPGFARITSNMVAGVINRDYVSTARLLGVPGARLFTRHLLPNIASPLLVLIASSFALTLLDISSLSFVGLGVQSPEYDFGRLLNEALPSIYSHPIEAIAPSFMLIFSGVAAMMIGDGLAARHEARGHAPASARKQAVRLVGGSPRFPDALVEVSGLTITDTLGNQLVKGISFSINQGEIVGLVGESGSGKSLTAMSLAGLLADGLGMNATALRLGDLDLLTKIPDAKLAKEIGLVYQDPGTTYNPALRMGVQLTEVARVHLGMARRDADASLIAALGNIRVRQPEERMRQHPHQLSGGMLQRATIASSMVTDPSLIIADEPTTALDVTVQAEVLREFKAINSGKGTSMLFITHDLGIVQELCDRVLVMRSGEIVERLTGDQLKRGEVTHDYTRRLLETTPTMTSPLSRLTNTIEKTEI